MPLLPLWDLLTCYRVILTFTCTLNSHVPELGDLRDTREMRDDVPVRSVVARGQVLVESADTTLPQDIVGPCEY